MPSNEQRQARQEWLALAHKTVTCGWAVAGEEAAAAADSAGALDTSLYTGAVSEKTWRNRQQGDEMR